MIVPVQYTFRYLDPGSDLLNYVERQVDKLRGDRYRLTQFRIRLCGNQHHTQGGPYHVHIEARIRGRHLQIAQTGEEVFTLVRNAFDALRNRFDRRRARRRSSTWRALQEASAVMVANPMLEGAAPPRAEHVS